MHSGFNMKKYVIIIALSLGLIACNEYQKILKSDDPEFKYTKAVEYFEKKDFLKATTLFDEISRYFRGTERSEQILIYIAKSYVGQKDYTTASEYFKTYVKTYPKGTLVIEARYMIGYCYYMESPDARLDQEATKNAISAFQEFLDIHPESERVPDVNKLLDEMKSKLAYKEYLSAKLYYNLGNYLGNNYLAAVITAQNALKNYPTNSYKEELSYIILQAKYQQALQSVEEKKIERYRDTLDEYYNFINEYAESKFKKDADRILNDVKKVIKE